MGSMSSLPWVNSKFWSKSKDAWNGRLVWTKTKFNSKITWEVLHPEFLSSFWFCSFSWKIMLFFLFLFSLFLVFLSFCFSLFQFYVSLFSLFFLSFFFLSFFLSFFFVSFFLCFFPFFLFFCFFFCLFGFCWPFFSDILPLNVLQHKMEMKLHTLHRKLLISELLFL